MDTLHTTPYILVEPLKVDTISRGGETIFPPQRFPISSRVPFVERPELFLCSGCYSDMYCGCGYGSGLMYFLCLFAGGRYGPMKGNYTGGGGGGGSQFHPYSR